MHTPDSSTWGATLDEWRFWAYIAGSDLLPAVSSPKLHTLPRSLRLQRLEHLHKTPSRVGHDGTVYGVAGWAQHRATPTQVQEWAASDYNILLITRRIRALDIDIADPATADHVQRYVESALGLGPMPTRYRDNSGKRTILIALDQDVTLRKRVIHTPHGNIEWLADGQQTALCGTHPSGARFLMRNLPTDGNLPRVPLERMCSVWDELRTGFADADSKPLYDPGEAHSEYMLRRSGQITRDPVLNWLDAEGLVVNYESTGIANIRCPWEASHTTTTGDNATSWLPAGLGGKEQGAFRCLHSHCEHRKTPEFLRTIGYDMAAASATFGQNLPPHPLAAGSTLQVAPPAPLSTTPPALYEPQRPAQVDVGQVRRMVEALAIDPSINQAFAAGGVTLQRDPVKGSLLQTWDNRVKALAMIPQAFEAREDRFSGNVYVRVGSSPELQPATDMHTLHVRRMLEVLFATKVPKDDARDAMEYIAGLNTYDSAQNALLSLAGRWDGVERIKRFGADILKAQDTPYAACLGEYIFTGMVGRILEPGAKADIVPILVSRENTGKSTLIRQLALLPEWYGEISLDEKDADLYRRLIGKVVLEWPELKGMVGREAESTKAFITQQADEWVPKFKERARISPRRSIIIGGTNRPQTLVDPTGNRRYAPIHVATTAAFCDHPAFVAYRTQYWAEALAKVQAATSPADAIEDVATRLRILAAPYVKAATLPWHRAQDLHDALRAYAPGAPVTLQVLGARLFGSGSNLNRFTANELRSAMQQMGIEQIAPDVWRTPAATLTPIF